MDIKKYINSAIDTLKSKATVASKKVSSVLAPINETPHRINSAINGLRADVTSKLQSAKLNSFKTLLERQSEFSVAKILSDIKANPQLQNKINQIKQTTLGGINDINSKLPMGLSLPTSFAELDKRLMQGFGGQEFQRVNQKMATSGYKSLTPEEQRILTDASLNFAGMTSGMTTKGLSQKGIVKASLQEIHQGKNALTGLFSESGAMTKARRSVNLDPKEVYKNLSAKTKFTLYKADSVKPTNLVDDVNKLVDISPTEKGFKDVYRNFEKVFGPSFKKFKANVLDPFDKGKADFINHQNAWSEELAKNVPFKKGSKESGAIQLFGEKKLTEQDLIKQFGQKTATKIIEADKWFRKAYDTLLTQVNKTRALIYPNFPEMQIPKRQDYYRHFQELDGVTGLKNIFETPSGIDPNLVGLSDFTIPKTKFLGFAQKRTTEDFGTVDAVGGFLDYLPKSSYATYIDPHIQKFRGLQAEIVNKTGQKGVEEYATMNNFLEFLEDFANDLSGKTNPLDRGIQKYVPGGRSTFKALDWLNKRVKANQILGNASSSVAQIFNVPQGIASAGEKNFIYGLFDASTSPVTKTEMANSAFLKERYFKAYDKFDTGIFNSLKKATAWMTGILDELGTKAIWSAHYKKAISEGIENASKYADDVTRKLVGGRGVGEVPLVQKSKVFQIVAPFQLEVANLWHVMGDMAKGKEFGKLAKLLVYNYVFNSVAEPIVGRRITFDPINALSDSIFNDSNPTIGKTAGRMAGEVLSNLPLGQTVAGLYPENGVNLAGYQSPSRQKLFGESDPTRFGEGVLINKAMADPLYKILPPFGGAQLNKTIEGVKYNLDGGSYNINGKLQFPSSDNPLQKAQSVIFGKASTPEARNYYDQPNPLSEKQTKLYEALVSSGMPPKVAYDQKTRTRGLEQKVQEATKPDNSFNLFGFLKGGKETSTPTEKSGIFKYLDQETKQTEEAKIIGEIFSNTSTPEQAQNALDELLPGTKYQDAMFTVLKSLNIENRSQYLFEEMSKQTNEEFGKSLQAFVENKVITSSIIDNWEETGKITESRARTLKNYIKLKTGKKFSAPKVKRYKVKGKIKKATKGSLKLPKVNFKPLKIKIPN